MLAAEWSLVVPGEAMLAADLEGSVVDCCVLDSRNGHVTHGSYLTVFVLSLLLPNLHLLPVQHSGLCKARPNTM